MNKKVLRIPEYYLEGACASLFAAETQLPENHPVRAILFRARCLVGDAKQINRARKSIAQKIYEYELEDPLGLQPESDKK